MKIVKGNLFSAKEPIIAHQVNCMGVMNSGVAAQVKSLYPKAFDEYKRDLEDRGAIECFGTCCLADCGDKIIANLFGQFKYGYGDVQYTDYEAFVGAIEDLILQYSENNEGPIEIAIPYKIGCCRGGGNWRIITLILRGFEYECNVKFTAYCLED